MHLPTIPPISQLQNLTQKLKHLSCTSQWQNLLTHYHQLHKTGLHLQDPTLFPSIFKACTNLHGFNFATSLHSYTIKQGLLSFISINNSIADFYMKCGTLGSALNVFSSMHVKDSISWNVVIHGCVFRGVYEEGLDLFVQARSVGFEPNVSTLVFVIQACRDIGGYLEGLGVHGFLIRSGFIGLGCVQNSLLSLYAESGEIEFVKELFDDMSERDVISWSVVIGAYVQSGESEIAFRLFREMVCGCGVEPDELTVVSILKGCVHVVDVCSGRLVHGYVICRGFGFDTFVGNSLVDMYSKCVDVEAALKCFNEMTWRNIVSWNCVLSGLVYNGCYLKALSMFDSMEKAEADEVTLVALLQACKKFVDTIGCKSIHARAIRWGFENNDIVKNTLIDAYAKCDLVELAWCLFRLMERRDMVSWSTMVAAFSQCGMPDEALSLFRQMTLLQEKFNSITMLSILESCSLVADLRRSKWAHGLAIRKQMDAEVAVGTALVDMYSKCGAIELSRKVFDHLHEKNIVSWSAMISAYGMNGQADNALSLLTEMELNDVKPNTVTMISALMACSHGGLTEAGLSCFEMMVEKYGLEPKMEHYACMVDMLGRAGDLRTAMGVIERMPAGVKVGPSVWGALLSACRDYANSKLGRTAASNIFELEPSSSAGYLLASGMYAASGLWNDAARVRLMAKEKGVRMVAGYSLVHIKNKAHRFVAGDSLQSKSEETRAVVEQLHCCIKIDRSLNCLS